MFGKFRRAKVDLQTALFRPPEEVVNRTDTIDALLEADKKRLSPTQRAIFTVATAANAVACMGGNVLTGGHSSSNVEIQKVWGQQDQFEPDAKAKARAQQEQQQQQ